MTFPVAAGDTIRKDADNGLNTRLTAAEADIVALETRMGVSLRRAATQTLNDAANVTLSWDTQDVDTDNMWAIGTPTVITIPADRVWAIAVTTDALAVTTGRGYLELNIVSAAPTGNIVAHGGIPVGSDRGSVSWTGPLEAGDTFTVVLFMDMAAASVISGANLSCYAVGP